MKHPTDLPSLPSLTASLLLESGILIDNQFARLWKSIGMKGLLKRAGFTKRSGVSMSHVVYSLSLWLWLKKGSIGMFSRDNQSTAGMGKDVLYDTLNREDLDWRQLNLLVARKAVQTFRMSRKTALVADDSIRERFGKKMPGVASHFDHTTGRSIKGQQVLTLGYSCDEGFVPLDSELFTSKVNAQPLQEDFKDGRSIVANRHRVAVQETKPMMLSKMVKRALRQGIEADYLLADAWFGSKAVLRLCEDTHLVGILRMKKGKLKYRVTDWVNGQLTQQELDAKALYKHSVRKQWERIPGQKYQAKVVDAEVNLAANKKDDDHWLKVRLLFVRGAVVGDDQPTDTSSKDWALFIATDPNPSAARILEYYAMRWAIEVYFKEAK